LFDIGKTTGQSFKTAAQAALEFSRQGLSVEETLKRTTDALTLTRFTSLNAAEAVDVLTAAANSFGESGITTAQIINKLVAVDTKFAVSAEDLANGLARAGSIAQEVGVNFDELNAAITVAQERTARGGAVIGNALKTIFTRLRSDETVQALRDIGVESLNAQGQLKGAVPLLQEVAQKIQGLSGGERIQILEAVASKYNINILSALLDDLNNANSKFTQAVAVSAGASNQAYERQIELNKTLAAQINAASVSVTQLFNKLSQIGVTDSLATLLKFVSDLINGFNKLVDSEGLGGNIAKGLVKGISDVFFTIGLPIIGAIFIKLTKDIAQFGVESLKTILGINQQVRERQALEQAVVNTLIRDQEIMASILALSGNRAKQEEYLLGVYNRQLNALQQVQNIAKSVTPALMAGGLSATTGQIQKRGAGGYLPTQEAADVRRGVGGASPSSRVVSIPNFAFGGGKRGTMIANTSEYIVPNFANGGSAIFNRDMAKAYGLPAGAKKISAADGYVPNFAAGGGATWRTGYYVNAQGNKITQPKVWDSLPEAQKKQYSWRESYKDLTGKTLSAMHSGGAVMLLPTQEMADRVNDESMNKGVKPKEFKDVADFVKFRAYGFSGSRVKNQVKSEGANEGVAIASIAENVKKVITNEGARVVNLFKPLTKTPISGDEFEKFYDEKGGAAGAAAGVAGSIFEAAMDYSFNNKKSRAAQEAIAAAEANNITFDVLNFKQARTLKAAFGASGSTEAFADYKISPERARTFADQIIKNNVFAKASSGFIPNFAAGSPLGDAINREMAAGVSPNKIRITQDGRLRNAGNPGGLAVINTRDEPNGRIPNFADYTNAELEAMGVGPSRRRRKNASRYTGGDVFDYGVSNNSSTKNFELTTGKLMTAFVGLQIASSTLQSTFKDTDSVVAKALSAFGQISTTAAGYGTLGSLGGEALKGRGGILGKAAGYMGPAGMVLGAGIGIYEAVRESKAVEASKREIAAQKDLENIINTRASAERNISAIQDKITEDTQQYKDIQTEIQNVIQKGASREISFRDRNLKLKELEERKQNVIVGLQQAQIKLGQMYASNEKAKKDSSEAEASAQREIANELTKRIALTTQINNLNEASAAGENKVIEQRAKKQSEFIKNSYLLNDIQKRIKEDEFKLLEIDQKRDDLRRSTLLSAVTDLSKAKLGTVDEEALNKLRKRLEAGDDIKNIEEEIRKLNIQGNSEARILIDNLMSQWRIKNGILDTEKKTTKERQDAIRFAEKETKLIDIYQKSLDDALNARRALAEVELSSSRALEEASGRTPIAMLQNIIATQPFATKTQEYDLARLTEEFDKLNAKRKIQNDLTDINTRSFIEFQNSTIAAVKGLQDTNESFKTFNIESATNAKNISQLVDILNTLKETQSALTDAGQQDSIQFKSTASAIDNIESALRKNNLTTEQATKLAEELNKQLQKNVSYRLQLLQLREEKGGFAAGIFSATNDLRQELENFDEKFGRDMTLGFRDGLKDAMGAVISQTDDLNGALQNVAMNFLKSMQSAFLNKAATSVTVGIGNALGLAKGGLVSGGSGYRDDVPAMLTGGEFVMRKSAVQKYGAANLAKMNSGGIFLPGVRGGGAISGYDALRTFANQTTTSGATDVLRGGGSSAFINLEDQSARLSRFALLGDNTINQEIRSAQEQGLNIIAQREAYRTQQRKAFQQQLVGTILSAAASYGAAKIGSMGQTINPKAFDAALDSNLSPEYRNLYSITNMSGARNIKLGRAYGGMIRRYASGGPTDDIPALLMSGEYIMNRGATSKYGKRLLDSMNQGRAPRFADGGEVGATTTSSTTETTPKMTGDVNISINVSGQGSQTEAQGNTNQGGIDYKKMSERIKAVVLETINEEKRLGGALRSR
jgi:TP901 family phage tail tape measure protein